MYLDGTMKEVEKIRKIGNHKGITAIVIAGNEAIEESIKNLYGKSSPDVIHIATHGFFFPDVRKNYNKIGLKASGERVTQGFRSSDNPLMRSGLAFAGANHAWEGEKIPPDVDDGILTAYEVSNMYIPNTELVVLSACETGLGEIKGSEGVFGLQRSFKMAGSDYILMSLWQIPDYQTLELMDHFYTEWLSGKAIQEALRVAQDFMKSKYPLQPFMWAAFVLVR
jgi:CHAT domain-containing protein